MYQTIKIFFLLIILSLSLNVKSQTIIYDSTSHKLLKFEKTLYFRCMPLGIYSGSGYPKDRIFQYVELGKTFGMFDIGASFGRISLRKDTLGNGNKFLEGKITMDVCQYGIFSSEMTIGAGTIFHSTNYLVLELSYTIYAQFWKNYGLGIITGYVDYSGNTTDSNHNTFGIFIRYGLLRPENGGIINISRMAGHHFKH